MEDYEDQEWVEPGLFGKERNWGVHDVMATDNAQPQRFNPAYLLMGLSAIIVIIIVILGYAAVNIILH